MVFIEFTQSIILLTRRDVCFIKIGTIAKNTIITKDIIAR